MRFEPLSDAALDDPYPQYAAFRADDPVHRSDRLRAWVLFDHADVTAALRDDLHLSADRRRAARGSRAAEQRAAASSVRTVTSDPPDGQAVRSLLNAALVPLVRAMQPRIDALVEELLGGLVRRREADLVADLAYELPVRVIAELLDVPAADRPRFQELSRRIARGMDRFHGGDEVTSGLHELGAYFVGLVGTRRNGGGTDLVSGLARCDQRGDRLTDLEVVAMCTALVFGGHETTVNLIANGTLALLRHPDELGRLRDDPALIATAIEELLRYDSPPQFVSRVVTEPLELRGRALAPGESVLLGIGAANRDARVFAEPDRLDLGRSPNPHLAFGLGTHFCPGAQLARMEARAAIGGLVARFPGLALAGAPLWRRTFVLRGLERLPVRLA